MTTETKATSLHGKIMNIVCDVDGVVANDARLSFKLGHKQARHAAAELAAEHEAGVAQLVEALEKLKKYFPTDDDMHLAGWDQVDIDEACNAYDAARAALLSHKGER
jgi:hypothetical protein